MIEFDADMGYLLEAGELDCVVLNDESGEHEPMEFVPKVGRGTCKYDETETIDCQVEGISDGLTVYVLECTECGGTYEHVNGDYEYCPRCGRRCEGVDA